MYIGNLRDVISDYDEHVDEIASVASSGFVVSFNYSFGNGVQYLDYTYPVFVNEVVRCIHAASLISVSLLLFSGFSQTGPACCQFRVFPDQRCGFCARAVA